MRNLEEILKNGKLNITTQYQEGDDVQIRANYNDPVTQKQYWCKFTRMQGWEHVTVSGKNKVPEWNVMCKVKEIFWEDEECCIEYHPRKSQYVNNDENCLHIWKPIGVELPEPPTILLGFTGVTSEQSKTMIHRVINSMSLEERLKFADKFGIKVNRQLRKALKK